MTYSKRNSSKIYKTISFSLAFLFVMIILAVSAKGDYPSLDPVLTTGGSGSVQVINISTITTGCPGGFVIQNISSNTAQCVSLTSGGTFNITYDATSQDVTANRSAFLSTFNSTYASFVQGNSSWNESIARTLFYSISNPLNFINQSGWAGNATTDLNMNLYRIFNATNISTQTYLFNGSTWLFYTNNGGASLRFSFGGADIFNFFSDGIFAGMSHDGGAELNMGTSGGIALHNRGDTTTGFGFKDNSKGEASIYASSATIPRFTVNGKDNYTNTTYQFTAPNITVQNYLLVGKSLNGYGANLEINVTNASLGTIIEATIKNASAGFAIKCLDCVGAGSDSDFLLGLHKNTVGTNKQTAYVQGNNVDAFRVESGGAGLGVVLQSGFLELSNAANGVVHTFPGTERLFISGNQNTTGTGWFNTVQTNTLLYLNGSAWNFTRWDGNAESNLNMNTFNVLNMSYLIATEISGACDLTINHSKCSNVSGTYVIG